MAARQYNPSIVPAENIRLTLADQVANGATAAAYQTPATTEEAIARVVANNNQLAQDAASAAAQAAALAEIGAAAVANYIRVAGNPNTLGTVAPAGAVVQDSVSGLVYRRIATGGFVPVGYEYAVSVLSPSPITGALLTDGDGNQVIGAFTGDGYFVSNAVATAQIPVAPTPLYLGPFPFLTSFSVDVNAPGTEIVFSPLSVLPAQSALEELIIEDDGGSLDQVSFSSGSMPRLSSVTVEAATISGNMDGVLITLAAAATTDFSGSGGAVFDSSGSTSGGVTAASLSARNTLVSRGWTIITA